MDDQQLELGIRPLSARSVVLSLLLGAHPPELAVSDLVRSVEPFGVSDATLRVALTRMVAAGDLERADSTYRLSDRLRQRQLHQDEAIRPQTVPWSGDWELAIITATGRSAAERSELRSMLTSLRLAELREGVWLRPANLARAWPQQVVAVAQRLTARPEKSDADLVNTLWELDSWAHTGRKLLQAFVTTDAPDRRFVIAAATVRHLLTDPALPKPLLPVGWPADRLRDVYDGYRAELTALAR